LTDQIPQPPSILESVRSLLDKLGQPMSERGAYLLIAKTIKELAGSDYGAVLVYEKNTNRLLLGAVEGYTAGESISLPEVALPERLLKVMSGASRSISVCMSRSSGDFPKEVFPLIDLFEVETAVVSSVFFESRVIGFLVVGWKKGSAQIPPECEETQGLIADSLAIALNNTRKTGLLRRSVEEKDRILSLAPIAILSLDPKGIIRSVNNQMLKFLERKSEDELVGTSVFELGVMNRSGLDALVMQGMEGHPAEKMDVHFVPSQDRAFYLHAKVTPLVSETGDMEGVLLVAMDTSSKVRLENQLERSYEKLTQTYQELERVTKMKSQFIDVVSHELRTPLTVMRGYIDLIESEYAQKLEPKFAQKIRIIKANTDKLYSLVESMLDVSRLEKGSMEIHPEPVRVDAVLEDVTNHRRDEASAKNQSLALEIEGELPLIMGDRRRLRDVFNSLVDNAIKYTPEGGKIQVGSRDEGKLIHVWVKDNGVGIPLENLGRIFDRFYIVASNDLSHPDGRIGLSLPISKGVIEAHGGRLWVESQVGKGSVFHVDLPK